MDTLPWQKMYINRAISLLQEHSNKQAGMWFKLWCTLSNSKTRWTKETTLDVWSRILGEDKHTTRKFMTYLQDKFQDMKVISSLNGSNEPMFKVVDEYYKLVSSESEAKAKKSRRFKTDSLLHQNRLKMFKEIQDSYHPNRNTCQVTTAKNEFFRVMRDTSRTQTDSRKKILMEKETTKKILSYVSWLSTTEEWEDEGVFVQGFGNFMKGRPWEYDTRQSSDNNTNSNNGYSRDLDKQKLISILNKDKEDDSQENRNN